MFRSKVGNADLSLHISFAYGQLVNYGCDTLSFAKLDHPEPRLSATHKHYLHAMENLAQVRRLLSRAGVQINVAGQQVVVNER